jgi:hypothetical protein
VNRSRRSKFPGEQQAPGKKVVTGEKKEDH